MASSHGASTRAWKLRSLLVATAAMSLACSTTPSPEIVLHIEGARAPGYGKNKDTRCNAKDLGCLQAREENVGEVPSALLSSVRLAMADRRIHFVDNEAAGVRRVLLSIRRISKDYDGVVCQASAAVAPGLSLSDQRLPIDMSYAPPYSNDSERDAATTACLVQLASRIKDRLLR